MSQEYVLDILRTFGPLEARELATACGKTVAATKENLRRLHKWGEADCMYGRGPCGGRRAIWWAV